jgi:hypothetical protein
LNLAQAILEFIAAPLRHQALRSLAKEVVATSQTLGAVTPGALWVAVVVQLV